MTTEAQIVAQYLSGKSIEEIDANRDLIMNALSDADVTLREGDEPVNHFADAEEYWIDCHATRVDQLLDAMTKTNDENRRIPTRYLEELTSETAKVSSDDS